MISPGNPNSALIVPRSAFVAVLGLMLASISTSCGLSNGSVAVRQSGSSPAGTPAAAPKMLKQGIKLPRLVDMGASMCIPCKMMIPILDTIRSDHGGQLDVVYIDIFEQPEKKDEYNVQLVPTQLFIDPEGKELFRHEGFFTRDEILAKWKELGYNFIVKEGK